MNSFDFSLIIACYNEERFLKENIAKIVDAFNLTKLKYEIIFVDDKSSDCTVNIIKEILTEHPDWRLIEHKENMGRGRTVSDGIKASRAPIVGFIDIDLSTSAWYLPHLIYEVRNGADIASARRVYKLKPRVLFRWVLSKGYNLLMRLLLSCNLQDTETGCKVFNRERILLMLDKAQNPHWFWDTEIMVRSLVAGHKIVEVPSIFIREGLFSRVQVLKDSKDYLLNLIKFRQELKRNGAI